MQTVFRLLAAFLVFAACESAMAAVRPANYRFVGITDFMVPGTSAVRIDAYDVSGQPVYVSSATVNLSVVLPNRSTVPLFSPASINFQGSTNWSGSITLPELTGSGFRLRVTDPWGVSSESGLFDVIRSTPLVTTDLVWDASRSRLYASTSSSSPTHPKKIVAIDPNTLQVTGSVAFGQEAGQLALTSGGEFLYATFYDSSWANVTKIDPSTMTVLTTFSVGVDHLPPYASFYIGDICTVAGQPDAVVVARRRRNYPSDAGVCVFDNGVKRPGSTAQGADVYKIEPSADPSVYFAYMANSAYSLRRLSLTSSGITESGGTIDLPNDWGTDMIADGNRLVWMSGNTVDGGAMKHLGSFTWQGDYYYRGARPEIAKGRVYFVGRGEYTGESYLSAFDPSSLKLISQLSIPNLNARGSLVRWGQNGFAFRTSTAVVVMKDSPLVPTGAPADLAVEVKSTTAPVLTNSPLVYTVTVTNHGPNAAAGVLATATLSEGQTISNTTASKGTPETKGLVVTLPVGTLAAGEKATLTVTSIPTTPGPLNLGVTGISSAVDANMANNSAIQYLNAGFLQSLDVVQPVRIEANNLVNDPTRNLIWATTTSRVVGPLATSLITIDPRNGSMLHVASLPARAVESCMALSANGRYLYLAMDEVTYDIHRYDLSTSPPGLLRIPLGILPNGYISQPKDIEVLDGDGTSFLMVNSAESSAQVYDGAVRRPIQTGEYTVDSIERTTTPGTFFGYRSGKLFKLVVQSSGVTIPSPQPFGSPAPYHTGEMRASGDSLLFQVGDILDSTTLKSRAFVQFAGSPCLDAPYRRAYLATYNSLKAYDLDTGAPVGTIPLPSNSSYEPQVCIRWGVDGLAVAGVYGPLNIIRSSLAIPSGADLDADGIADAWTARNFGTMGTDRKADPDGDGIPNAFEYLFGTPPLTHSRNPMRVSTAGPVVSPDLNLTFQRRAGMNPRGYVYEASTDLKIWTETTASETVLSTETVGGVLMENISAEVVSPDPKHGFIRLAWRP